MTAEIPIAPSPQAEMVCEALELDPAQVREFAREPLGAGSVVGFEVHTDATTATVYVDTSGIAVDAETGLAQEGVGRIWFHPADPHLPSLAATAFGTAAETLLARLGVTGVRQPEFVGYRPGRRAVLRVQTDEGAVWIKVVRPRHVDRIVTSHAQLREAGLPVPLIRAWSPSGLLVIAAADGIPATDAAWTPQGLVDAVDALRETLSHAPSARRARTAALARVEWYTERITSLDPSLSTRMTAIRTALARTPNSHETTIHGDLHYGQLFLDETATRITGLIDVDTCGTGDAAEDPAAFLSHVVASAQLALGTESEARPEELLKLAAERWGMDAAVRGRTAAQLLGHTAGALERGQSKRAMRLLASAEAWAS